MANVFDCFTFFNEIELLDIRLHEHAPIVDRFVLVEATRTYTGHPKPLHFQENRDRFAPFLDRIIHIVVDDLPLDGVTEPDNLRRETHQRNALARGLGTAQAGDYVIISDVDEIIRAEAIERILRRPGPIPSVHLFELRWFYYFVNYEKPRRWLGSGPRMTKMRYMSTPQRMRDIRPPDPRPLLRRMRWMRRTYGRMLDFVIHRDAGWHFSYIGGIDAIVEKLGAYQHIHPEAYKDRSHIVQSVASGRSYDPADTDRLEICRIDASFPGYLRRNVAKFQPLIVDEDRLRALRSPPKSPE